MSFPAGEGDGLPIFEHNRLEDKPYAFRLIQLFPASDTGQEVSCELVSSDLEELPNYKALSYVWGDSTSTRNIYIEGKPYRVTKNCYAALACLRRQSTQMTLWIDAICINQGDPEEKNHQLKIMVDIYAEAEETLIWMGFNNTPWMEVSSLEKLRYVEKLVVTTIIDLTSSSDLKDSKARYNAILIEPAESDVLLVWETLIAIFRHPWWTRLWVHQELAAAQKATVVVGLHTFAWELFLPLLRVLGAGEWEYSAADLLASPKLFNAAVGYCRLLKSNGYQSLASRYLARDNEQLRLLRVQQRNLEITSGKIPTDDPEILDLDARDTIELLYWTRRYHCTDPRDHVFALRGLLTDGEILAEADYTTSTKEVYARFARRFISIYQSTNILRLAGITWRGLNSSDNLGACPSWIPYLGTIDDFELLEIFSKPLWNFNNSNFAAAKGLGRVRKTRNAENDEELSIFGYPVDALDILQPFLMNIGEMSFEDFNRSVWRELAPNLPPSYPTGCDPKHALFRVLIGDQNVRLRDSMNPCQEYVSDSIAWIEHGGPLDEQGASEFSIDNQLSPVAPCSRVSALRIPEKMLLDPTWSSTIAIDLKTSIEAATACRKFLRTDRGFMGLAPQLAEVGDEVWVLLGCDVPMLLRKCDDYYILVGECFVYGIMEGEQTKDLLASGPPKNITLH
jgi:hypothetical protein